MKATIVTILTCLGCCGLLWVLAHPTPYSAAQGRVRKAPPTPAPMPPSREKPPERKKPREASPPVREVPKIEMVTVPGGSFLMGSLGNETWYEKDERPQHRVTVSSFAMGKYEINQAQWQAVMGDNPSNFKGNDLPIENISWNDAKTFCQKLSSMTGETYRLPTEAEWEYAARAGTTGAFADDLDAMAWYGGYNAGNKTHPCGQKKANAFGLYDMYGNVWEWCEDVWHDNYNGAPTNGSAWLSGGDASFKVLRGGSWNDVAAYVRAADRSKSYPNSGNIDRGFRVALSKRTPNRRIPSK